VLLLHKLHGDSHQDGWDNLAEALQEKGYAVLSFDFRGHGKSTTVDKHFWDFPWNRKLRSYTPLVARRKETISSKDFLQGYSPYLVNDIAAARLYLDEQNDLGQCNTSNLVVIGAEDGGTLGCLWMASEWYRHGATVIENAPGLPPVIRSIDPESAGKDQLCAVWLTLSPNLGGRSVEPALKSWLALIGRGKKESQAVPMAFLHGARDDRGASHANAYRIALRSAKEGTDVQKIADTKLTGSALLRSELKTQSWIIDQYLNFICKQKKKRLNDWTRRDLDRSAYVWVFPNVGIPRLAKGERSRNFEPIPIERLGLNP
jgi:pimeloyl-ACP methyl ester carboxylesterase